MKNIVLAISTLLLVSTQVKAESFHCVFTEPYLSLDYSTKTEKLTTSSPEAEALEQEEIEFQIAAESTYNLVSSSGEIVATITHKQETDGASDLVYPFSILYKGMIGACSSKLLKAADQQAIETETEEEQQTEDTEE